MPASGDLKSGDFLFCTTLLNVNGHRLPSLPRENAKKKNSCKGEGKEKKFMQKEGPIVTFSESLSFRNQQYYQAQYE